MALFNSNIEYNHEAQISYSPETQLEALNEIIVGSLSMTGMQIYRAAAERDKVSMAIFVQHIGEF